MIARLNEPRNKLTIPLGIPQPVKIQHVARQIAQKLKAVCLSTLSTNLPTDSSSVMLTDD